MQQNQVIADLLWNLVGDDGKRGDNPEFGVFQESRSDEDAVHEIVESVADEDQQPGTPVVVRRGVGFMGLAVVVVAMPPEHQFFKDEKHHDTEQDGGRHLVRVAVLQRMRQDFQECRAQQGADGVRDQDIDPMSPNREAQCRCGSNAQGTAGQRYGNDPG